MKNSLELTIVADTCGIVGIIENLKLCQKVRKSLKYSTKKIIIPKFVVTELAKIRGMSEYETIQTVSNLLKKRVSIIKCNCDVESAANEIETKYPKAHFPDSLLIALAKFSAYSILTYDKGILDTAKAEGIQTISIKKGVLS